MENNYSNYIKNRKIVYQCSYCGTQYVNVENCPGCNASTAESKVIADNLDAMIVTEIDQEQAQLAEKRTRSVYLYLTVAHLLSIAALIGFITSPLVLLTHLIYHLAKRKKPHPVVIIDGLFCLLMTVILVFVLPDILD